MLRRVARAHEAQARAAQAKAWERWVFKATAKGVGEAHRWVRLGSKVEVEGPLEDGAPQEYLERHTKAWGEVWHVDDEKMVSEALEAIGAAQAGGTGAPWR